MLYLCLVMAPLLAADPLATSFDWPVKPVGAYRKSQEHLDWYDANGKYHLGEDWNRGSDNDDLGDPVYCVAAGQVVKIDEGTVPAWGRVIVVAHILPGYELVYSIYAHLKKVFITKGQIVAKGQKIGTIGDADGYYRNAAHLHFALKKRAPFPPKTRAYEAPLGWQTIDDYHIPSLFIANRREPYKIKLKVGKWTRFTVPGQAPLTTAYLKINYSGGGEEYFTLTEALLNGVLKPVIRWEYPSGSYLPPEEWPAKPSSLANFIFRPDELEYDREYLLKLPSGGITSAQLTLFPLKSDDELSMALRTKSDLLWSARTYGPSFITARPETFSFSPLTFSPEDKPFAWLAQMSFEVTGNLPTGPVWHYMSSNSAPLLERQVLVHNGTLEGITLPAPSPNKVD